MMQYRHVIAQYVGCMQRFLLDFNLVRRLLCILLNNIFDRKLGNS